MRGSSKSCIKIIKACVGQQIRGLASHIQHDYDASNRRFLHLQDFSSLARQGVAGHLEAAA